MSLASSGTVSIATHANQQPTSPIVKGNAAAANASQSPLVTSGQAATVVSLSVDKKREASSGEQRSVNASFERQDIKPDEKKDKENLTPNSGTLVDVEA